MDEKDLYKILGVSRTASADEIKKAYRKLARQYHPDVNQGDEAAEERFKQVSAAFDVLGNAEKRALYDEFGLAGLRDGFDPAQARAYQQWAGGMGGGPGGPGGRGGFRYSSEGFGDLGDLFEMFGGGRGRARGPRRGNDVESSLRIDLLKALRGGPLSITVDGESAINVSIPPGVADGKRIRLAGKGEPGVQGGPPGDLLLRIHVEPHPTLRREGDDLYMKLQVTLAEAISGAKLAVPTPDGATVTLTVPRRSQNGQKLRLRGKGAPKPGSEERGDLYVELDVRLPTATGEELDSLAEKLAGYYTNEAQRPTSL